MNTYAPELLPPPEDNPAAVAEPEWPTEVDEVVLIFVVHPNCRYAAPDDRHEWSGWYRARWTDFNGGGWTWYGMAGQVTHVMALLPAERDTPSTE